MTGVCGNVVPSTAPPASVNGDDVAAGIPVQNASVVYHRNVTVPVGVGKPACPVTVAWSCTVVPTGTVVTVACVASWITVAVDDATVVTVNGSQAPVDPV